MNTSVLALATILAISQGYATGGQQIGEPSLDKKTTEKKRPSHPELRQGERGDPSQDRRVLEHATELKNRLEPHELPENFWDFEKLEEENQKHTNKSLYDSSKEDRGDPLRGTWIDGENEGDSLRQSGVFDRETGQKTSQESPQISTSPEARTLPPASPQAPAPQKPEEIPPLSLERTIRDAGEWPVLPAPTEE